MGIFSAHKSCNTLISNGYHKNLDSTSGLSTASCPTDKLSRVGRNRATSITRGRREESHSTIGPHKGAIRESTIQSAASAASLQFVKFGFCPSSRLDRGLECNFFDRRNHEILGLSDVTTRGSSMNQVQVSS